MDTQPDSRSLLVEFGSRRGWIRRCRGNEGVVWLIYGCRGASDLLQSLGHRSELSRPISARGRH